MTTDAVSPDVSKRSRKIASLILQRLASVGQVTVANGLGVSESNVSRLKDAEIEKFAKMLALLDLKVVPLGYECLPVAQMNAILTLAQCRMKKVNSVLEFCEDDEE